MSSAKNPTTINIGAVKKAMGAVASNPVLRPAGRPGMKHNSHRKPANMRQRIAHPPMRWSGLSR